MKKEYPTVRTAFESICAVRMEEERFERLRLTFLLFPCSGGKLSLAAS